MSSPPQRRLVVFADPDAAFVSLAATHLASVDIETHVTATVAEARRAVATQNPDVLVSELLLPDGSGLDLCREVRAISQCAVIFVSEFSRPVDRVAGLSSGADDFMAKPVHPLEFELRVRVALRRLHGTSTTPLEGPGGLIVDTAAHVASVGGTPLELTPLEFNVLASLLIRRGEVLSLDEISRRVWGFPTDGTSNYVEAHLSRLRSKLRPLAAEEVIENVRGVGYVIR